MPKVAAIVGPSAVGKSEIAVEVAEGLGAEIVSVDSMQIYIDMDVGTAKPSRELRTRVPHHLLDLKRPSEELTVHEFQALSRRAVDNIAQRGVLPLLVGGSGLYLRAVVDDLRFPPRSSEVRAVLEDEVEQAGPEALHRRLAALDPRAAQRIEPQNARRTVRALEAITLTGRPFSENDSWDRYESIYDLCVAGLERSRDDLYARIEARVEEMLDRGLVDEVEIVSRHGIGPTAAQALGYRQVLEGGSDMPRAELRDAIAGATKRFARRQLAWFKADPRITWFDTSSSDLPVRLMGYFRNGLGLP